MKTTIIEMMIPAIDREKKGYGAVIFIGMCLVIGLALFLYFR